MSQSFENPVANNSPQELSPGRRMMIAGVLVGMVLVGGELSACAPPDNPGAECAAPADTQVKQAYDLLTHSPGNDIHKAAKANHVELPKLSQSDQILYGDLLLDASDSGKTTPSFNTYLQLGTRLFAQSDIVLRKGTPGESYTEPGTRSPRESDLETDAAKKNMLNIIGDFLTVPTEYFKTLGLREVVLTAGSTVTAAYTLLSDSKTGGPIYFDMSVAYQGNISVLKHEGGHLLDIFMCKTFKRMANDPTYTQYNTMPYHTPSDQIKPYTYEDWRSADTPLNAERRALAKELSKSPPGTNTFMLNLCHFTRQINDAATKVEFSREYANESVLEDKADMIEKLERVGGNYQSDVNQPTLINKETIELARMLKVLPNTAHYFADINKYNQSPFIDKCPRN